MTHVATDGDTSIWYKNKRVWRTVFSAVLTLLVVAPQLVAIINEAWPSDVLAFVLAQLVILQAVVTRIMAIDAVNRLLAYVGLGSAPREVLVGK